MKQSLCALLSIAVLATMAGCSPFASKQESMFIEYMQRLANVLDVDSMPAPTLNPISTPTKRELHTELDRVSLGLLESYQLRACGLFNLIAEKNSLLGKVQDQFSNIDYEIKLLVTLDHCIEDYPLSTEDSKTLHELRRTKQAHFPTHVTNLVLTSDALRNQLNGNGWLEGSASIVPVKQALNDIALLSLSHIEQANLDTYSIQKHQEVIDKSEVIGELYFSLVRANQWLDMTTVLLQQHTNSVACGKGRDMTQFRYLKNVFQLFYIDQIQPYLADLNRTYTELQPSLEFIELQYKSKQSNYPISEAHQYFMQSTLNHVKFWQSLFKRCNALPQR